MLSIVSQIPMGVFNESCAGSEKWTGEKVKELVNQLGDKVDELEEKLRTETRRANRAEAELREATTRLERDNLSAIEVLRRMYQGVDAFDHNRFKCAVEAIQFEMPKKTENTSQNLNVVANFDIATRIERARLRVIDGGADVESADPPTEPTPEPA